MQTSLSKQCVAEFIGTFALIIVGVGVIANHTGLTGNAGLLAVACGTIILRIGWDRGWAAGWRV